MLCASQEDWPGAQHCIQRAISLEPKLAGWWRDLGVALVCSGNLDRALEAFSRSWELREDPKTLAYIAQCHAELGRSSEALTLIEQVRTAFPPSASVECDLGRVYELLGDSSAAVASYRRSIALDRNAVNTHERLANLARRLHRHQLAHRCSSRLARLRGYNLRSLRTLAGSQFAAGHAQACAHTFRRVLAIDPAAKEDHSFLLFTLLHDGSQSAASLRAEHENWFHRHAPRHSPAVRFGNIPDRDRPLRIGYLSGEFKACPTYPFFLPMIRHHNRSKFAIYCYQLSVNDSVTGVLRQFGDQWRDLQDNSPEQIRETIIKDKIDILIDLSGHYGENGLAVFHLRAAPVQVAYPNYPSTTGCRNIDYMFADQWVCPPGAEANYSERAVWRLPSGYIIYERPEPVPPLIALPALTRGYVTFGIFQRCAKLHNRFWDAVGVILRESHGSRLLVQNADNDLEHGGAGIPEKLADFGIDPARIDFAGYRSERRHFAAMASVDIALDASPYSGQTTTSSSLSMGVPVVTLPGETHASRVSHSLLSRVGLGDWSAVSWTEYIAIACAKASDIPALAALRSALPRRFAESNVCRPAAVVGEMEAAFREMWRAWCDTAAAK